MRVRSWGSVGRSRFKKRKDIFVEANMAGDVYPFGGRVKTPVSMMNRTVPQKDTRSGSEINLVPVIRTKIRKTLTTKNAKKGIIRFTLKNMFIWRFVGGNT